MKVYSISKWAFGGICVLIFLLPVSRHWHLLSTGKRTTGTVTSFAYKIQEDNSVERLPMEASEIEFEVEGVIHKTYGPDNYEYKKGRSLTIFYDEEDPDKNCVVSFTGFYLNYYAVIPIVLLVFWYAFYLSFNNYRKRKKKPKFKSKPSQSLLSKDADR